MLFRLTVINQPVKQPIRFNRVVKECNSPSQPYVDWLCPLHADFRPIQSLGGFLRPTATQTFPHLPSRIANFPVRTFTLNTLAQAVVVHAALTPSPAYSGLNKENGRKTGWGKNGGGEGECPDGKRAEEPSHVAARQWGMKRSQRVARRATIRRTGLMGSFAAPRRPTGSLCGEMLAALAYLVRESRGSCHRPIRPTGRFEGRRDEQHPTASHWALRPRPLTCRRHIAPAFQNSHFGGAKSPPTQGGLHRVCTGCGAGAGCSDPVDPAVGGPT
eukprot:scaffold1338_cov142-Isochrysis_galbana.AAC.1